MAPQLANGPTHVRVYDDPESGKMDAAAAAIKELLAGPGWMEPYGVQQIAELTKIGHEEIQTLTLLAKSA